MKKLLGFAIAFAAILILVGCESNVAPEAPLVTSTVADSGATLVLSWSAVTGADGYIIYADGVAIDTITTTTYDATVPAALYAVSAYAGADESATDEIDCTPVETANKNVYGLSDPDVNHHSGLGFNAAGTAVTYSVVSANYTSLDFFFDDLNFTDGLYIVSPSDHVPAYNTEENASAASTVTSFDALTIAAAPGNYNTQRILANSAVYSLWIDPNANNWDATEDHFAKMKVESLTGTAAPFAAVITLAYQPIAGLRWLVTD